MRLYNAEVVLSPEEVARLRTQLAALAKLPADRFIHTLDFGQDAGGAWFRITPWLPNVMAWGDLKSRELHGDAAAKRRWLDLCLDLAETFRELHRHGRIIPEMSQMVDPDPAERPRDMESVCEALRAFGPDDIAEWRTLERDPWRRGPVARRVAVAVVLGGAIVCVLKFFGDVLTTDADLQPGNSGGPVLDLDGYAVGIASGLFAAGDRAETSMGRVLPINTARRFLEAARAGRSAWDGLLEAAFEPELVTARQAAGRGDWEKARALAAVKGVAQNPEVSLTAAVYSLDKVGFTPDGRAALERVTAMAPTSPLPRC